MNDDFDTSDVLVITTLKHSFGASDWRGWFGTPYKGAGYCVQHNKKGKVLYVGPITTAWPTTRDEPYTHFPDAIDELDALKKYQESKK